MNEEIFMIGNTGTLVVIKDTTGNVVRYEVRTITGFDSLEEAKTHMTDLERAWDAQDSVRFAQVGG